MHNKTQAIILAGGSGSRFGGKTAKQFAELSGKSVLARSADVFERCEWVSSVIIVVYEAYSAQANELKRSGSYQKIKTITKGGRNRSESAMAGLAACDGDTEYVLIHDAARPFVTRRMLNELFRALQTYDAVNVAIPATDLMVEVDENRLLCRVPDRGRLMRVQTPQAFKLTVIQEAYRLYEQAPFAVYDDCSLVRHFNLAPVYMVEGEEINIKITYPEDIFLAEKILERFTHFST